MKYLGLAFDEPIQPRHREMVKQWHNRYTPDIVKLEKYKSQLLFVCDEFMSDRRQHFVLEDDIVQWNDKPMKVVGFTEAKFDFLLNEDIALPFPTEDGKVIKGEILVVTPNAIKKLDKLKLNTVMFYRKQVPIVDPYRPYGTINNGGFSEDGLELPPMLEGKKYWLGAEHLHTHGHVWMYFPHPDYWDYQRKRAPQMFHRVPTFTPKKEKTWLGEYYKFQNPEDS